jgi:predicted nuclease of predicted toxin-antitoxin system
VNRFLLDANLSPETGQYLIASFGVDVLALAGQRFSRLTDSAVVSLAQQEQRVIITLDKDFGELYHRWEGGQLGVIILRLRDESIESVNAALGRFFRTQASEIDLEHSFVVLDRGARAHPLRTMTYPPSGTRSHRLPAKRPKLSASQFR